MFRCYILKNRALIFHRIAFLVKIFEFVKQFLSIIDNLSFVCQDCSILLK